MCQKTLATSGHKQRINIVDTLQERLRYNAKHLAVEYNDDLVALLLEAATTIEGSRVTQIKDGPRHRLCPRAGVVCHSCYMREVIL